MLALGVAVATLLVLEGTSGSTIFIVMDSDRLLASADAVLVGEVQEVVPEWNDGRIVSRVTVLVEDTIKGKPTHSITIASPGGRIDGVRMAVIGGATFTVGERAVLFLREHRDDYHVVGLSHGKLDIDRDSRGDDSVRWIPPGKTRFARAPLSRVVGDLKRTARQWSER